MAGFCSEKAESDLGWGVVVDAIDAICLLVIFVGIGYLAVNRSSDVVNGLDQLIKRSEEKLETRQKEQR